VSVRVCYIQRRGRGMLLSGLRLVGATTDESWSAERAADQTPADFSRAASWVREKLQGARSSDSLELLCLDPEGSAMAWMTAATGDTRVLAMLARTPQSPDGAAADAPPDAVSPVAFFAPSDADSSVEPLGLAPAPAAGKRGGKRADAPPPQRIAVLACADVPARLLIDALDQERVRVSGVCTFWHALAAVWTAPEQAAAGQATAIVLVDNNGRLTWCWGRDGSLIAGGGARLRVARPAAGADEEETTAIACTPDDAARVAGEWLSWAVQLGAAPTRVVCVLPESMGGEGALSPGEFCELLASRWPGAALDAAVHADPLGATLARLVTVLEKTPRQESPRAEQALVALANRPGATHRRMYLWSAAAIALAGAALFAVGLALRSKAAEQAEAARAWPERWRPIVQDVYAPALEPRGALTPADQLEDELKRRQDAVTLPEKAEHAKPVLKEFEALSLVLGAPGVKVENVTINTDGTARVVAVMPSTQQAEAMLQALQRVSGSILTDWTADIQPVPGSDERRAVYIGKWPPTARGTAR